MFLVTFVYTADLDDVHRVQPEHRSWLETLRAQRLLLIGGPMTHRPGGVVVAAHRSRETLDADLANDPYVQAGVARHEVIEFTARMAADELIPLLA